ncbi:MAG: Crp/Fnr family transcriptional regulator [Bacteriovoracaceae bacterium]|jgi:CRP-like cAMP-binding protein|nr:Crp/Fnr family transcriptional regulator [Bacteriovoracaceae bacterium]
MKVTVDDSTLNQSYILDDAFKSKGVLKSIPKGLNIYTKGKDSEGFYYIISGLIGLVDIAPNGVESLLRVHSSGTFTGYRSFLSGDKCNATSVALTDVTYLYFEFADASLLLKDFPSIYKYLIKVLCHDLKIAEQRLNDLSGKRVMNRIIESLVFLKQKDPEYPWTRREIGEFCSATTETVTRTLSKLEKVGLIEKSGRDIVVSCIDSLLDFSRQQEANY